MSDETRMPFRHELKTWEDVFQDLWDGRKTAEFRKDDRGFQIGDFLDLKEFNPERQSYSGRFVYAEITHIVPGGRFGMPPGHSMLSLHVVHKGRGTVSIGKPIKNGTTRKTSTGPVLTPVGRAGPLTGPPPEDWHAQVPPWEEG